MTPHHQVLSSASWGYSFTFLGETAEYLTPEVYAWSVDNALHIEPTYSRLVDRVVSR